MKTAQDISVAVFGETLVDTSGPVPVVGGTPFNVARHLAGLGLAPLLVTRIGADAAGREVLREFDRFSLPLAGLQTDHEAPTAHAPPADRRVGNSSRRAYDAIDPAMAAAAMMSHRPSAVYFGTLAQRGCASRTALHWMLRAGPALRYLDLNLHRGYVTERCVFESLAEADVVKVSQHELLKLFSWYAPTAPAALDLGSAAVQAACFGLVRDFHLRLLLVALDTHGALSFSRDGEVNFQADLADQSGAAARPSGANDAFSALCLLGLALSWPLPLTLERAAGFAAAVEQLSGAVPDTLEFYRPFRTAWLER